MVGSAVAAGVGMPHWRHPGTGKLDYRWIRLNLHLGLPGRELQVRPRMRSQALLGGFLLCLNQPTVSKRSCGYLRLAEPQAAGLMCIPWLPQHFSSPAGTCWQSDSQAG